MLEPMEFFGSPEELTEEIVLMNRLDMSKHVANKLKTAIENLMKKEQALAVELIDLLDMVDYIRGDLEYACRFDLHKVSLCS